MTPVRPAPAAAPPADPAFDLLIDGLLARLQAGEAVDWSAVAREHPGHAERLRSMVPALAAIGDLSGASHPAARALAADAAADDLVPGVLGDFRIFREVGRGGMGVVYEAEQVSLGRRVALKVLPFAATMDPKQLQRFKNEAKAAASLKHEHIVSVYAVGCERGVHYFAMEFIEGHTLAHVIHAMQDGSERPVVAGNATLDSPPIAVAAPTMQVAALSTQHSGPRGREFYRRAADLIAQAADALEHAHQVGIVHRDVKPGNLMVDQHGKLWVADFGLARFGPDAGLTLSGDLLGTLRYMAPEQALARHGLVDHRADVYGLGATLYELLTGRPAVDAAERAEVLRRIAFEDPTPPRKLDKAVPAELETVALTCLAKDPAERYATAGELADDLRRWLEHGTIRAKPPSLRQTAVKWAQRHTAVVWSAVVILLILAGSLGWVVRDWQARRAEAEGRAAEALAVAESKLRDGNPHDPELVSAARTAEAQLAGGVLRDEVRRQVEQLLADLAMLERLQEVRLAQAAVKDGHFDTAASDPAYARAFREYGIDVEALDVPQAAAQLRPRAISQHLAAALDDWSLAREWAGRTDWQRLLAVAGAVDPDPWRCALRDARATGRRAELEKLLTSAPVPELPPTSLALLGSLFATEKGSAAQAVAKVLRAGQRLYPADFWVNEHLGWILGHNVQPPQHEDAIRFFQAALAIRPQSPGVHLNLGNALKDKGRPDEAIACYREALRLKPDYAQAYASLGNAFMEQGKPAEAEAAYRRAIELQVDSAEAAELNLGDALFQQGKLAEAAEIYRRAIARKRDYAPAHYNLGTTLAKQGKLAEAAAAFRKAIELKPDFAAAHYNLGNALTDQGKLAEAEAAYRKAVELTPDGTDAHYNLGNALRDQGKAAEAEAAYRQAIKLKPNDHEAYNDLGNVLLAQGKLAEAEAAYRQSLEIAPQYAMGHFNLGNVLQQQGKLAEAEAAYRKAIELKPDYAEVHCNLGHLLGQQGRFAEALAALRRGHELGSRQPGWRYPSAQWVRQAERLPDLDAKLARVLSGHAPPAGAAERVELAEFCLSKKQLPVAAVRLYEQAFAAQPALADDLGRQHRYNAACAAALAGCGRGQDAGTLGDGDRVRLRRQALGWLRDDLSAWGRQLDQDPDTARPLVRQTLRHWQGDADLAGVRGPAALARLPAAEGQPWQALWEDVAALPQRADAPKAPPGPRPER
jgi:tetratricopeptide (TPR) repeat protein/serine/threonine protein kinase